jgi:copper resistance protein B
MMLNRLSHAAMAVACAICMLAAPTGALAQTASSHDMNDMNDMKSMSHEAKPTAPTKDGQQPSSQKKKKPSSAAQKNSDKASETDMPAMDHRQMQSTNHSNMPMPASSGGTAPADHSTHQSGMPATNDSGAAKSAMPGKPMESMSGMKMGPMQGGSAPADARDPNAYAEGTQRTSMRGMEMADNELFGRVLVNELEATRAGGVDGQKLDAEAWYGGDYNKAWMKLEGERRHGRLEGLRSELLWDRAMATFWSTQLGIRHDTGGGPAQDWLAFGVRGLAPYWFETEATAYVGKGGMLAARAEGRYELLLTQRLILQPKIEANLYSQNDASRGNGSGLSDLEVGLRLRYEIRRQFAPYIGISWTRKFGNSADFARQAGEDIRQTQAVAGVRIWF